MPWLLFGGGALLLALGLTVGKDLMARIAFTKAVRDDVIKLLKKKWPGLYTSSMWRSEERNKLIGGSPTSKHPKGLAFDLSLKATHPDLHKVETYAEMARTISLSDVGLKARITKVIAESTPPHLHVEVLDPLGKVDKVNTGPKYLVETKTENKFERLV